MGQENHSTVRIRVAGESDMGELADLRWRLCTEDAPERRPLEKKVFIEAFCSQLGDARRRGEITHFVAEVGHKIVAVMSIVKVHSLPCQDSPDGVWGYLTNVYALPEFRDKGIGSHLLTEMRRWSQKQRLELLVVWPSDRSYPFYERSGFLRERDPLVLKIAGDNS